MVQTAYTRLAWLTFACYHLETWLPAGHCVTVRRQPVSSSQLTASASLDLLLQMSQLAA